MQTASYTFVVAVTLAVMTGDILLTNGFMLLRLPPIGPGIPINEALVAFALGAILFTRQGTASFTRTAVFPPLVVLWLQTTFQLAAGVFEWGVWAVRDAAHIIESSMLFVGFCLASDPRFLTLLLPWFRGVLIVAACYILLFPLQTSLAPLSPAIRSLSGYEAPLFFSYGNPASIGVTAACLLILDDIRTGVFRTSLIRMLTTGAVIMALIVFVQVRVAYLQLAFLLLLVLALRPQRLADFTGMLAAASVLMALFLASGIELPGRLGQTFTFEFLANHLQAIWGGGDESISAAAQGVDLRLNWWLAINDDLQRNLRSWIFGLGYGMPLTSFRGPTDDVVREPHNSFVSVYGRLGLLGIAAFLWLQFCILRTTVRLIGTSRRYGDHRLHTSSITMLCFFGVHLIYSTVEGGFEVSFIAVPYYFLAGVCLALDRSQPLGGRYGARLTVAARLL